MAATASLSIATTRTRWAGFSSGPYLDFEPELSLVVED